MPLTARRATKRYGQEPKPGLYAEKVKAATFCYAGGIAVMDAGYACPGRVAVGLIAVGRFEDNYDNSTGANGDKVANILSGVFKWANYASDLIGQADVGQPCFIFDDLTVARTSATNTRSRAGIITAVDSDGVWVLMGFDV